MGFYYRRHSLKVTLLEREEAKQQGVSVDTYLLCNLREKSKTFRARCFELTKEELPLISLGRKVAESEDNLAENDRVEPLSSRLAIQWERSAT